MTTTKDALKMAGVALVALDTIEAWTHLGGAKAETILAAVRAAVGAVKEGTSGATSPQVVTDQIDSLHARLIEHDQAADAELATKYPANTDDIVTKPGNG